MPTKFPSPVYGAGALLGDLTMAGAGNVYYVMQSTNTLYPAFSASHGGQHDDGSSIVHTDIQSALDATVANRNDYVIVMPDGSDYDITDTLTMSKNRVHLICPPGLNSHGIPANYARIHQTTAATAIITVTADAVEIAGFFFKHMTDSNGIVLSGTRWCPIIHDNFFAMACADTGTAAYGVGGTGAISHASIYGNYFCNYSPGLMTGTNNAIASFIGITSNSSTRGLIRGNIINTGANTTVGAGIIFAGVDGFVLENYLYENIGGGGVDAGVLTLGISTGAQCLVSNNVLTLGTANNSMSGGTADRSYVWNLSAADGATRLDAGGTHAIGAT